MPESGLMQDEPGARILPFMDLLHIFGMPGSQQSKVPTIFHLIHWQIGKESQYIYIL